MFLSKKKEKKKKKELSKRIKKSKNTKIVPKLRFEFLKSTDK